MKALLTWVITFFFVFIGLSACEKSAIDDRISDPQGALKIAAANVATETRIVSYPYTYGWVWNKSTTSSITVACYYNMTTSPSSGWVLATTKTLAARKDFTYCKQGVKQIKLVITYDKNAGSYEFLSGKTYSCS
ncbi:MULTISPECIES: hypothetical protein [unclassified Spirosoma]|uniref:hypothetical protein n=1 Tax=unclassified Spirosoma TaxID=2621999 RepID=UPI00095A6DCC|nr:MULTISPECIES: hypothetical protein [unclassified Spirosoma]MBN8825841.1 hypothetical protein [Spirosoma sp.]OJW70537.1 MAG: hypothetical protein BGO59_25230 [Spirosoma sp. 48-14]